MGHLYHGYVSHNQMVHVISFQVISPFPVVKSFLWVAGSTPSFLVQDMRYSSSPDCWVVMATFPARHRNIVSTSNEMIWRAGYQDELWSDPYPDRWVCLQENWQDNFYHQNFFCNLLVTHVSFLGKFDPNLLRQMIRIAITIVIIVEY